MKLPLNFNTELRQPRRVHKADATIRSNVLNWFESLTGRLPKYPDMRDSFIGEELT